MFKVRQVLATPDSIKGCNIPKVNVLYGKLRALFGVDEHHKLFGFDLASIEARIQGHYVIRYPELGGPELAESLLAEKPNSIHCINARKLGITRDQAKSVNYGLMYGAQAPKLQSMLKLSPAEAERLYNAYWDALPSLKFLKSSLEKFWLASDKKHIAALDGRILTARSKHSLLNVLLQSGGSLVMKYAVLRLTQLLEEKGLLGNVLEDSELEGRDKAYQCIVYHDEVQIAIPKEWYNPQEFSTEEEAKAFRAEHHLSTPIHEEDGKWCIDGPNVITELVDQAILETKEHLKLRVDIGIEHSSGDTWADTH